MSTQETIATVARLLRRSEAHAGLGTALGTFPFELSGRRADGHPHTAWELVEHVRLAAEDLVAYGRDADYRELDWPDGYWPAAASPPSPEAWEESVRRLLAAGEEMATLLEDGRRDLYAPVPSAQKPHHHLLRAALVLLDHNGYHAGQLVALRRALGAWPP